MQFMLIMNTPRDGYRQYLSWPQKILEAHAGFMEQFTKRLQDSGELVGAAALASPEQAQLVTADGEGTPITDGVFAEFKEFLAGYWIVDVESRERAVQIAAEAARAPGLPVQRPDGTTVDHFWIEVRQVMNGRADML